MSASTVLAHGDLDDDPVRRLTPARVPAALTKLMAATDMLDAQGHTQRTLVETKERLMPADLEGTGERRVGGLVFRPDAAGDWHLTDIYVGDAD